MASRVEDIVEGNRDCTGAEILEVYGTVSGLYAVYRTPGRVKIQFADDDGEGSSQRATLASLLALLSYVDAVLHPLRAGSSAYQKAKALEYDSRISGALLLGLRGDVEGAHAKLNSVSDDAAEERASDIRTRHLLYAAIATAGVIIITKVLLSGWFVGLFGPFAPQVSPHYWNALAVGAIGALFSIALQMRSREVPVDLQPWDNATDAVLRILVGSVSAVILIAVLRGDFASLSIGERSIDSEPHGLVVAAFAAGFMERMVSNFLSGISIGGRRASAAPGTTTAPAPGTGNEQRIAGRTPPAGAPSEPALREHGEDLPTSGVRHSEEEVEPDDEETDAPGEAVASGPGAGPLSNAGPVG